MGLGLMGHWVASCGHWVAPVAVGLGAPGGHGVAGLCARAAAGPVAPGGGGAPRRR